MEEGEEGEVTLPSPSGVASGWQQGLEAGRELGRAAIWEGGTYHHLESHSGRGVGGTAHSSSAVDVGFLFFPLRDCIQAALALRWSALHRERPRISHPHVHLSAF